MTEVLENSEFVLWPRFRAHRKLHHGVVIFSSVALLSLYYLYLHYLPTKVNNPFAWFWSVFFFEYRANLMGVLLLVPILYGCGALGWKRGTVCLLLIVAAFVPYLVNFGYRPYAILASLSMLVLPPTLLMSVEIKLISDASERAAQAEKRRERQEVMRQIYFAQEAERKRISQELHDGVVQTLLANATIAHQLLEETHANPPGARGVNWIHALSTLRDSSLEMVSELRSICQNLRPSIIDNLGLVSAIKWLLDNLREETHVATHLEVQGQPWELSPEERVALFRIVQEALTNIRKHAKAKNVWIKVSYSKQNLCITVRDDGAGFIMVDDPSQFAVNGKLGLLGMKERAEAIGAQIDVVSHVRQGTQVVVLLPTSTREAEN